MTALATHLRGVGVAFVRALEEGYLVTRESLEPVVAALHRRIALVHLQSADIDIHADEFSHP